MFRLPARTLGSSSSPLLNNAVRRCVRPQSLASPAVRSLASASTGSEQSTRQQHAHAVANPTLANIEKRWEQMPPQEQAELWMALRDRMTSDWHELTMLEKKASYWIAFGPHGPRALPDPNEKYEIMKIILYCLTASAAIFATTRYFAGPPPKTMNKEWQEMTNEYLKAQKTEAITGVSSAGYDGPGMVQSPPSGKKPGEDDE